MHANHGAPLISSTFLQIPCTKPACPPHIQQKTGAVSKEPQQIGPQKLEKLVSDALAATRQADGNHFE
jgi:hypothetical protein